MSEPKVVHEWVSGGSSYRVRRFGVEMMSGSRWESTGNRKAVAQELARLAQENERLKADRRTIVGALNESEAENERLREALGGLKPFLRHIDTCGYPDHACACGLDAARRALEAR